MKQLLRILNLYHSGALAFDDTLYILESLCRADAGLIGARALRDRDGVLHANFPDGTRIYT